MAEEAGTSRRWRGSDICLVPVGPVPQEHITELESALPEILACKVGASAPVPLPEDAFSDARQQFVSDTILRHLAQLRRQIGPLFLGIADADLYTRGLNFVFGQADAAAGVAVIALPRLRQEWYGLTADERLFHEREVKEAVHEIGHMAGLPHCQNHECVMHFSNSLPETDRKGKQFCEECSAALRMPVHVEDLH